MNRQLLVCTLLLALSGLSQYASAASLRCGNHLILDSQRRGASQYEVLKKCGEPIKRAGFTWFYKSGSGTKALIFNGSGFLVTIRNA